MNRVFLYLTSAAALPLLADASLKGAALLLLAGVVALLMRRSSAAARHMVWLAAVVALLLVPVPAVVLPGWRVLPQWAVVEAHAAPPAAEHRPHEAYRPFEPYTPAPHAAPANLPAPASIAPLEPLPPTVAPVPAPLPPAAAPPAAPAPPQATAWLLPLWAAGCALLLLRLAAAHFLLRRNTRRCEPAPGPLAAAFAAAQQESGLRQPVRLLMDNARSIPVVWGVFRPTLLLPAEAAAWDAAQLRSVLLHELAHLRRRDPLVQFLTQIACALHWFNPLVWLAAWRLHVERERACDDMVLASGVRPSTYAKHLIHIATQLSPARWTQACGLAMARKSSLEGRLTAVLSDKLNRRRLTRALTAAAILLSAAIAVPIAMLRAQEEKPAEAKATNSETAEKEKPAPPSRDDYISNATPIKKLGFEIPALGKPKNGLSLGVRPIAGQWRVGSEVQLQFWITNTGKDEVRFQMCSLPELGTSLLLTDRSGTKHRATCTGSARWPRHARLLVAPGEAVLTQTLSAVLLPPSSTVATVEPAFRLPAGDYELTCSVPLPAMKLAAPDEGEWTGTLTSAALPVTIAEETSPVGSVAPDPAKGSVTVLRSASHTAMAFHRGDSVDFLLIHRGWLSSKIFPGRTNDTGKAWEISGQVRSIDFKKLKELDAWGEGTIKAEQYIRYWSRSPDTVFIGEGRKLSGGRVFIFHEDNSVLQSDAKLPELSKLDLNSLGELADTMIAAAPGTDTQQENQTENKPTASSADKLDPSAEAQLDWGEPVNGLRSAIVIRPTAPGAEQGIFLAVQNVSDKPLRFADTTGAKDLRKLYVSDTKDILFGLTSNEPTKTDATLQPREVAYLRLLEPTASAQKDVEPTMIEGLRKDSLQTWRAVLDIQNAPDGAWKGKLTTGETRGAVRPNSPQPKNKEAQALYKVWQNSARLNGDIPGGLVRLLHDKVKEFIRNNEPDAAGAPYATKMKPLEPRCDVAGDWKPTDVVALMDDIAAASTIPLETTLHHLNQKTLRHGQPLPAALENADWGQPLESGLRMAYLLEPRAEAYHLGTEVKARILLHNAGKEPVAFIAGSFHQPGHKAKLADGSELKLDATDWLTRSVPQAWRLAPGEYIELHTPGLGIGAQNKDRDDWASVRAGSWILCGDGDEVTFLPGGIMLSGADSKLDGEPRPWWPEFITGRLNREAPVPADTKEREYLLYRVVRDLFGTAPSTTEGDAFASDKSPDALKNLAALLTKHAYGKQSQGMIQAGETEFRVLPPDPDAARRVRVASNPGWYNLSDTLKFSVTRRPQGSRIINEASVIHFQQGKDNAITKVELPGGYNTWAAAMEPGTSVLWIKQKDLTRRYDFTDPAQIKETRHDGEVPARVLEAMKPILTTPEESPAPNDNPPPAATPAPKSAVLPPNYKHVRAHFERMKEYARANGDIPGGLVSLLDESLGFRKDPKLEELRKRLDATRDWPTAEVRGFLEAAAATGNWAGNLMRLETIENWDITQTGEPLPAELASLPWGAADDNGAGAPENKTGLRAAFTVEPSASGYTKGVVLPITVHYHNSGTAPLVFSNGYHSSDWGEALDAQGRKIFGAAADTSGLLDASGNQPNSVRLLPGHWISFPGAKLTVADGHFAETANSGGYLLMTQESTIKLKWAAMTATWDELTTRPATWNERVRLCVARFSPMPKSRADRETFIRRVTFSLTGVEAAAAEVTAFSGDDAPDAVERLIRRFQSFPPLARYSGWLMTGQQSLKITPGPVNHRGTVMAASGAGLYELADSIFLHHCGGHAQFEYTSPEPHPGAGTRTIDFNREGDIVTPHGIVWRHGSGGVWVADKERVRKYDYSVSGILTRTELPAGLASIPEDLRAALKKAFPAVAATAAPSAVPAATASQPRHEYAQSLFKSWQANARSDGRIPGALVGLLAGKVDEFIKGYTGAGQDAVKLAEVRPKLDATRDWTPAEAVALLDEIATINHAPLGWAEMPMKFDGFRDIKAGQPLPKELESAAWGAPAENGLRAAWLLEPRAEQYAHGTVLKARVLFHNSGKEAVVFQTETWHQYDGHKALDAKGAEISVKATRYTGITPMATFRLAPGEYCEVTGHGLAIGAGEYKAEFGTGSVGAIIKAKEGDTVTLSHTVDVAYGGWTRPGDPKDPAELRKKQIAERVGREAPLPVAAADRELLIRRVTLDLTGVAPTPEEIAAFTADKSPDALANLTALLQNQPAVRQWSGKLPTGETKFRVLPADPDATDKPKTGAVKLSRESLIGTWRGTVNGEKLMLSFHRPPAEKDVQCDIYFGEATIGVPASFAIAEDGGSAAVVQQSAGGGMKFGTLIPDEAGKLKLELYGRQQGQQETMLTRDAETPVSNERKSSAQHKSGAKLDRAKLEGTWEGEKDGATVEVEFQWLSEHQQVRWEVKRPGSSIGAQMSVVMAPDGNSADFIFRKGLNFEAPQGRVTPGKVGTLHLEIIPNPNVSEPGYPAVQGLVLKRNPDGTVPKTSEAGAVR